jgi:hypothetical protein
MSEAPLLTEETHALLHRLLDKADSGRMRWQLKCSARETPELYDFADQSQVEVVWDDLQHLAKLGVLDLKLKARQRPGNNDYDDGLIQLKYEAEETVRLWLERPAFDPRQHLWNTALARHQHVFEDGGEALRREVLRFPGRTYEQLAAAFAAIPAALERQPMTLRQLSARCFWGASKFLDRRDLLLFATFPSLAKRIISRPLLLSVYLPEQFEEVLFVENQDTYLGLVALAPAKTGLIYLAGFRGAALRVREVGQAVFSYVNLVSAAERERFTEFWLGHGQLPCYFWGDLDFAGMAILAALKQVFPGVEAWQPGYKPMVEILRAGGGHSSVGGEKDRQYHPGSTECPYADYVLIPAMEEQLAFVDQESIGVAALWQGEPLCE